MPDEMVMAIATALATRGAEAAVAGGKNALGALVRLVRRRFGTDAAATEALHAATEDPSDQAQIVRLSAMLTRIMVNDPEFDEQLRGYWGQVAGHQTADHGGVVNLFSGRAEKVVQARDIQGDINL
jgi:hypothetical protein